MRKLPLLALIAGFSGLPAAHAEGSLQGLEMDVMDAGESPSAATARIALPGARDAVGEGVPDDAGIVSDQSRQGGTAAVESVDHAAQDALGAAARDAVEPAQGPDVGEPTPSDGGGIVGEEPIDPGVIDGSPGDVGVIEPGGTVDGVPVDEPPGDGPPVDEPPPVEEPPPGVDEPPPDEIPIGEPPDGGVVPGDSGGGSDGSVGADGSVEPLPVEIPDGRAAEVGSHRL
jgi:hypothetical protein